MATRILEYSDRPEPGDYPVVPVNRQIVKQSAMTAGSTSTPSSTFNTATRIVCIQSDEAVSLEFGTAPTATADSYRLQAASEQFFEIARGASWKVAIKL